MEAPDKDRGQNIPQSPRFFRRKFTSQIANESTSSSKGKVVLGEVEEKLKSMRQKRLDRLSTFVAEQSKLSEERSTKDSEGNEIENAIMSMKQTKEERKISFKAIIEENVIQNKEKIEGNEEIKLKEKTSGPKTPILSRKWSNESMDKSKIFQKPSTTKKFINKFNCSTTTNVGSTEDLADDYEYKKAAVEIIDKQPQSFTSTLQEDKGKVTEITNIATDKFIIENPLLSPVGKQRRGIYMYETEWNSLENEKSTALLTFKTFERNRQDEDKIALKKNVDNSEVSEKAILSDISTQVFVKETEKSSKEKLSLNKSHEQIMPNEYRNDPLNNHYNYEKEILKIPNFEIKARNSFENINLEKKPPAILKTFKRNSAGDILDGKNIKNFSSFTRPLTDESHFGDSNSKLNVIKLAESVDNVTYENVDFQSKKEEVATNFIYSGEAQINNSIENNLVIVPPKSPIPLPRKVNNEDRIFKKFQRNFDSLNEILENDSDVDSDEIEDLKKTLEEASELLVEYRTKLEKLDEKSKGKDDCQKLNHIKNQLKETEKAIISYRGLRSDSSYQQLSNILSNCLSEINKVKCSKVNDQIEKNELQKKAEVCLDTLELKVTRNENMLQEILEALVTSISTNIFNITKV